MPNLRSPQFQTAVRNIERRAERQVDPQRLYHTYVDCGIFQELTVHGNQLVLGRRGVGKTHLAHFFRDRTAESHERCLLQIHDLQRLGSGLASEHTQPRGMAIVLFRNLLQEIATAGFDALDTRERGANAIDVDAAGEAILAFETAIDKALDAGTFDFRKLGDSLDAYREHMRADYLIIILDEWVAVPLSAQPYLAEYLKKSFFSKPRIAFKICTVTYQTRMTRYTDEGVVGIEPGADAFGDLDLDSYFVWHEDAERVQSFFSQVIYNHLAPELDEWDIDLDKASKQAEVVRCFTREEAFVELCRAAEGNARDLLNIFRLAHQDFSRSEASDRISIPNVKAAARTWYRMDKLINVTAEERSIAFLNHLVQQIIRGKQSKTFMVSQRDMRHPVLTRLFTARLLHPLKTMWSHPDRPGEPFNLVTMDYGSYLDLQGTRAEPRQQIFWKNETQPPDIDDLVPLDDRRSVRRIVVSRDELDQFLDEPA